MTREPPIRLLANRLQVHFVKEAPRARDSIRVICAIDQHGHIDITWPPETSLDHFDAREFLEEHGIARWRNVGPEDRELFLTKIYRDELRPALVNLSKDWRIA